MFKDERKRLKAWYSQLKIDLQRLEMKRSLIKVILACTIWSILISEIFFNSVFYAPLTWLLFSPVLFFLIEYVKICKLIQLQDKIKYCFELIASLIQGGQVIDTALTSAYQTMLNDSQLPQDLKCLFEVHIQKIKLNLDHKYSVKDLGEYTALKSIARVDWVCAYCVASGLEIDDVYLQCARNLGRQQIFRRELLHQLNTKQQEFIIMILAPGFVKVATSAMMGTYFHIEGSLMAEVTTGILLSIMYISACCMYLYTYNQMLRGTYENF